MCIVISMKMEKTKSLIKSIVERLLVRKGAHNRAIEHEHTHGNEQQERDLSNGTSPAPGQHPLPSLSQFQERAPEWQYHAL